MTVLFSELLVPGWADGEMIGLGDVTGEIDLPCHKADPELFFDESPDRIAMAKALCQSCPVITACLQGALSRGEPCGVWGGELFVDGQVVAARRTVGRPRLNPAAISVVAVDITKTDSINGVCALESSTRGNAELETSDDEALAS